MSFMEIVHNNYKLAIEEPEMYVDNQARGRSGHMTHAMAEFAPGCFIDFNSNCSAIRWDGHSPYGWVEYRISRDSGKTYSDVQSLPYSVQSFLDGIYMISVEKAVACDDGSIVALCLRNDGLHKNCCEPWFTPMAIISHDEGKTWTEPKEYSPYAGRTYDARYHNGVIYVVHFCNEHFLGKTAEHVYRLYTSEDNGASFTERSVIPFDTLRRGYCAMIFDENDVLHAYAYNEASEMQLDHAISHDEGKNWTVLSPCHLEKGIRNPQIGFVDGVFVLHGRAADCEGFVLYTSTDATNWDEGLFIKRDKGASAFYSNNLRLTDEKGNFLLVQYSDRYEMARVNVKHLKLRVKKAEV